MLLGIWRNIAELEESVNLPELEMFLDAAREREHRANKFAAAMKGIDLDAPAKEDIEERFRQAKLRADARLSGINKEHLELSELGIDVETD